jgi:hypothetical protein
MLVHENKSLSLGVFGRLQTLSSQYTTLTNLGDLVGAFEKYIACECERRHRKLDIVFRICGDFLAVLVCPAGEAADALAYHIYHDHADHVWNLGLGDWLQRWSWAVVAYPSNEGWQCVELVCRLRAPVSSRFAGFGLSWPE